MKKGKYRFIVQRTQEVLLTITDEAQFQKDFEHWAHLLGPDRAEEVTELDYLRTRADILRLSRLDTPASLQREVTGTHVYIEDLRTCRHCGCTDEDACRLANGNCDWHDTLDCCTNPDCVAAEAAESQPILSHHITS